MRSVFLALFFCCAGMSWAQEACPGNPQIEPELADLITRIQAATSEIEARPLASAMWILWLKAPDEKAQDLLDEGIARLRAAEFERAEILLTELVDYCPNYAEGYNQRAFSKFLRGEYVGALDDLDEAIKRSPNHVGALSGRALTLFGLGRHEAGQVALRAALEVNPWLSERALLAGPPGEEL